MTRKNHVCFHRVPRPYQEVLGLSEKSMITAQTVAYAEA